jgi:SHS2 domain-containing protein
MPYSYIDDIAIADVAFKAEGTSLEEVFRASWEATLNVLVTQPEKIAPRETKMLSLQSTRLDMLLFNFLNELVYFKDAQQLLLRVDQLSIQISGEYFSLHAVLKGETLERLRHFFGTDVKAATLHLLEVKEMRGGWEAMVVLDV